MFSLSRMRHGILRGKAYAVTFQIAILVCIDLEGGFHVAII
jgi:hypothetical protein